MSTRTRVTRLERNAEAGAPVVLCVYVPERDAAGNKTGRFCNAQGVFTRDECDERTRRAHAPHWIIMDRGNDGRF